MGVENDIQQISTIWNVLFLKITEGKKMSHARSVSARYPDGSGEPLKGYRQGNYILKQFLWLHFIKRAPSCHGEASEGLVGRSTLVKMLRVGAWEETGSHTATAPEQVKRECEKRRLENPIVWGNIEGVGGPEATLSRGLWHCPSIEVGCIIPFLLWLLRLEPFGSYS